MHDAAQCMSEWMGCRRRCTVRNGRARLDQSYLDSGYTRTNKKHVACQEVGHLFGLGHNQGLERVARAVARNRRGGPDLR